MYSDSDEDDYEQEATEEESQQGDTSEGFIATLSGVPRFHTLRVRGVVQGHRVGVLIDGELQLGVQLLDSKIECHLR